jgi:hypothetical protein
LPTVIHVEHRRRTGAGCAISPPAGGHHPPRRPAALGAPLGLALAAVAAAAAAAGVDGSGSAAWAAGGAGGRGRRRRGGGPGRRPLRLAARLPPGRCVISAFVVGATRNC